MKRNSKESWGPPSNSISYSIWKSTTSFSNSKASNSQWSPLSTTSSPKNTASKNSQTSPAKPLHCTVSNVPVCEARVPAAPTPPAVPQTTRSRSSKSAGSSKSWNKHGRSKKPPSSRNSLPSPNWQTKTKNLTERLCHSMPHMPTAKLSSKKPSNPSVPNRRNLPQKTWQPLKTTKTQSRSLKRKTVSRREI
jgi:hypothetical protein